MTTKPGQPPFLLVWNSFNDKNLPPLSTKKPAPDFPPPFEKNPIK
jgi:hypothetical protein